MEEQIKQLEEQVKLLTFKVKELSEASYKTSDTEIINKRVKFLQKVYNKDGTAVIN